MKIRLSNLRGKGLGNNRRGGTDRPSSSFRNLVNRSGRNIARDSCNSNGDNGILRGNDNATHGSVGVSTIEGHVDSNLTSQQKFLGAALSSRECFHDEVDENAANDDIMKRAASLTFSEGDVQGVVGGKRIYGKETGLAKVSDHESKSLGPNALDWLMNEVPDDLIPRVFSFLGSRKIDALSLTCSRWRKVVLSEPVWRTLSEDTGKWREGESIPRSWLDYYRENPCVPVDYNTIQSALRTVSEIDCPREQKRSIRILVHPGRYVTRETIVVHAVGAAEVTIESLNIPRNLQLMDGSSSDNAVTSKAETNGKTTSARAGRHLRRISSFLSCRSCSSLEESLSVGQLSSPEGIMDTETSAGQDVARDVSNSTGLVRSRERATLVLKTRKHNRPVVRVRQGTLTLKNVNVVHSCHGTDIWNGNAAVQVQPLFDDDGEPLLPVLPSVQPTAILENSDICSQSGRGIVAIDGGSAMIKKCCVHHCAATGIYVGGPGSVANIERTDVVHNGNGNKTNQRGIARGHSGIYLEQGTASVQDCNVSNNSLTGLSAISSDNATLRIEDSDIVANGSIQLELPPDGSLSRRRSISRNNTVSREGSGRFRSGLDRMEGDFADATSSRTGPQSLEGGGFDSSIVAVGAGIGALIGRHQGSPMVPDDVSRRAPMP